jgi:hypothetical protein
MHMRSFDRKRNFSKSNKWGGGDAQLAIANVTLGPIKSENVENVIDLPLPARFFPFSLSCHGPSL